MVICIFLGFFYMKHLARAQPMTFRQSADLSRPIFFSVMGAQAVVACLVASILTAGSVVAEKEKQTFEMLKLSTLSPYRLILGEILAAVGYQTLLLLTSLPVIGLVFLLGGISPGELVTLYLSIFLATIVLAAFGTMVSCLQEKTNRAMTSAIGGIILFSLVFPYLMSAPSTKLLSCINPLMLFWFVIGPHGGTYVVQFFNWEMPLLPTVGLLSILFALIFITLAARKVFSPDRRALSTKQVSVLLYGLLLILMAGAWNHLTPGYLNVLMTLFFMLILYIFNQTLHPQSREAMQYNLMRAKRPDHWSFFALHLILGNLAILLWMKGQKINWGTPTVYLSALIIIVVTTSYRSTTQLVTYLSKNRGNAIRNMILILFLLMVLPILVGGVGLEFGQRDSWTGEVPYTPLWRGVLSINPIIALLELQSRLNFLTPSSEWEDYRVYFVPWQICCAFHFILWFLMTGISLIFRSRYAIKDAMEAVDQERNDSSRVSPQTKELEAYGKS